MKAHLPGFCPCSSTRLGSGTVAILPNYLCEFGSIKFHNILGSDSVYRKLSKNDFFKILANYFGTCQIFGPFFGQNDEFEIFAHANQ
jgi:hypothetical protein